MVAWQLKEMTSVPPEEADVIIVQHAYYSLTEATVCSIQVICDETVVFILWPNFTINRG